jgi:hypothetical protein
MSDTPFRDPLQQIASAAGAARNAHAARNDRERTIDKAAAQRLAVAEKAIAADRQWAAERTREVAAVVEEGLSRLPGEIDPALTPAPQALSANSRAGLESAAQKAKTNAGGIQEGARALLLWRAKRSSLMGALGIGAVVALVLVGALVFWVVFQARAEETAATQTAAAATVAPTRTAVSLTATREAEQTAEVAAAEATSAMSNESATVGPAPTDSPTLTLPPPTRTPRPPPTPGSTPTSLPPGAIICPGSSPTRLTVGGQARVINYQLNVRSGPGTHHSVVRRLDPGRTVDVLDGPVCDDGQLWYYILSEEIVPRDGSASYRAEGWLVEESGDTYYLEPLR